MGTRLVEVLGRDSRGDFVNDRDARHATPRAVQEMHDVPAGYKEAMGVAELNEPIHHDVAVLLGRGLHPARFRYKLG
jgi:hypothetical protein